MDTILIVVLILTGFLIYKVISSTRKQEGYKRWKAGGGVDRKAEESDKGGKVITSRFGFFSKLTNKLEVKHSTALVHDEESVVWCANLLGVESSQLKNILNNIPAHYRSFRIRKRRGGYRVISAPDSILKSIQQTIYRRILLPVNVHPAATGFRVQRSVADNARPHLGNRWVLKADIHDFFGSIRSPRVREAFQKMGYPENISKVLGALCCEYRHLPQGAATSPALSNIIVYEMDQKLAALAAEMGLTYTRYADDLTFSGDNFSPKQLLLRIQEIVKEEAFALNDTKTRFMGERKRKIITGVSISSGNKLTIPKVTKREIRKNVHFILKRGLAQHKKHIGSSDPAYLKRLLGQLCYWRSIEPDNLYVSGSIEALKRLGA